MRNWVLMIMLLWPAFMLAQTPYEDITDSRQDIQAGTGIAFTGKDAAWGYSMHASYHYYLTENFSFGTGLAVMHFRDNEEDVLRMAQAEMLEAGLVLHLMPMQPLSFELGGGGNLRYFHWGIATNPGGSYTFDNTLVRAGNKEVFDHFTGGYFLSAGFSYRLTTTMKLFFREMLQNDSKNNTTWDSRLGLKIRF